MHSFFVCLEVPKNANFLSKLKQSQKEIGVKVFCDRDPRFSPLGLFHNSLCEDLSRSSVQYQNLCSLYRQFCF